MSTYLIVPMKSPGKTVHLDLGSTSNGTKIQLWDKLTVGHKDFKNQVWLWDGTIFRSGKDPRKCLHLEGGRTSNGTKIVLKDVVMGKHADQEWRLEGKNIVSRKNTSMCWHLDNGNVGNGTKIHIWNLKNHQNGMWNVEFMLATNPVPMANSMYNTPMANSMYQTPMSNSMYQTPMANSMYMTPKANVMKLGEGASLVFPNKNSQLTVQLAGGRTSNGTKIVLGHRLPPGHKDFMNQVWLWDGTIFRSGKDPSKSIILDHGKMANRTKLILWKIINKASGNQEWKQHWIFQAGRHIRLRHHGNKFWSVSQGQFCNGTDIELHQHQRARRDRFEFTIRKLNMGARM